MRKLVALGCCVLASLPYPGAAHAASGDGGGLGLVIGVTHRGSFSLGWEGAVSLGAPVLRFDAGGSYQLTTAPGDPAHFHYVAWEPWVYVGATLGVAVTSEPRAQVMYGLWEGYAEGVDGNLFASDGQLMWAVTLALGWRGIGGTHQFYAAPKVWYIRGFDFFT